MIYKDNLIIAPHPDDELFCTGLILTSNNSNSNNSSNNTINSNNSYNRFYIIIITDGSKGYSKYEPTIVGDDLIKMRYNETSSFCNIFSNIIGVSFLQLKDGEVTEKKVINKLEFVLNDRSWYRVFVPHLEEFHPDHRIVSKVAFNMFNNIYGYFSDPNIADEKYRIFSPDIIIRLTPEQAHLKLKCAKIYKSQKHFLLDRVRDVEYFWLLKK